jgi:rhodanese-related sulfurtransferase
MIEFFKNLFAAGPRLDIDELVTKGAVIVDVRTEREFKSGHITGAINIPLDQLPQKMSRLKKDKPVITCCASGMRSATAKKILMNNGFTDVYNVGSWTSIKLN